LTVEHRAEFVNAGQKATEANIDALAHADERYAGFVHDGVLTHAELVEMEVQMSEIEERILSRNTAIRAFAAEVGMTR
jgi:hypothetical protein